jgi:xylulokinase
MPKPGGPGCAARCGSWAGAHGRAHFYRAVLEGIAFEQRLMSEAAAAAAGWYPDIPAAARSMSRRIERLEPDPDVHRRYDRLYGEVYQPLFPAVRGIVDRLTGLSRG